MNTVLPLRAFEPFTPAVIDTMQAAFNEACEIVGCSKETPDHRKRELIALHIIECAQRGIDDIAELRDEAVAHVRGPLPQMMSPRNVGGSSAAAD